MVSALVSERGVWVRALDTVMFLGKALKGAQSRLNGLKSLAKLFKIRCLQSVSIFSILNHPCSIMVYYYLFDVFLCL